MTTPNALPAAAFPACRTLLAASGARALVICVTDPPHLVMAVCLITFPWAAAAR